MEDPQQTKLFEENAGEISPAEEGLYLGTCGWSYADWEGTVYPPGTTPAARLAEYVKHFATVEIDSTFIRHSQQDDRRAVAKGRAPGVPLGC